MPCMLQSEIKILAAWGTAPKTAAVVVVIVVVVVVVVVVGSLALCWLLLDWLSLVGVG